MGRREKADGKLTMPVKFRGVTGDFGAAAGTFGIGRVVCDVLDSNAPVAPELLTGSGSPIHVLKAGEEEELTLRLRNPRSRRLSGVLKWSLAGVRGEPLGEAAERIGLEPGREKRLVLPRPAVFGVYKLNVELTDDDPAVRPYRKEMRFAYLIPAGPTPERNDGFVFGVCSHPQRHGIEEQRKEAMAAGWCGAKALREDIEWFRVQPAEGRWEFGSFDRVVETFGEYGVEVMPIFAYLYRLGQSEGVEAAETGVLPPGASRLRPLAEVRRNFRGPLPGQGALCRSLERAGPLHVCELSGKRVRADAGNRIR